MNKIGPYSPIFALGVIDDDGMIKVVYDDYYLRDFPCEVESDGENDKIISVEFPHDKRDTPQKWSPTLDEDNYVVGVKCKGYIHGYSTLALTMKVLENLKHRPFLSKEEPNKSEYVVLYGYTQEGAKVMEVEPRGNYGLDRENYSICCTKVKFFGGVSTIRATHPLEMGYEIMFFVFCDMEDNWDGYNGYAPNESRFRFRDLITVLPIDVKCQFLLPDNITPSGLGDIELDFINKQGDVFCLELDEKTYSYFIENRKGHRDVLVENIPYVDKKVIRDEDLELIRSLEHYSVD